MKPTIIFKTVVFISLIFNSIFSLAQRPTIELRVTQPSPNLNIRLLYDKYNLVEGQNYTIIIQNLSNKNIHVKGQLVALLLCGNEVSTRFDEVIKPYEKVGGESFFSDMGLSGLTGIVRIKDCQNPETVLDEVGHKEHNRIKTLQLRSYNSVIEKTDEELMAEKKQKIQEEEKKQIAVNQQQKINNSQRQEQYNYQTEQNKLKQQQLDEVNKSIIERNKAVQDSYKKLHADIETAGNTIMNNLKQKYDEKNAAQKLKDEADDREEALEQENMKRKEEERKAEHIAFEKEQRLREQEDLRKSRELEAIRIKEINEWKAKSWNLFNNESWGKLNVFRKVTDITNNNLTVVYYVIWNFSAYNKITMSSPIKATRTPDGDWILMNDLQNKIEEQTNLKINTTPDGLTVNDNEFSYLLGYFETDAIAESARKKLINSAIKSGMKVIELQNKTNTKVNPNSQKIDTKSFWDEK